MSPITQLQQAIKNLAYRLQPEADFNPEIGYTSIVFADVSPEDPLWWDKAYFIMLDEALLVLGGKTDIVAYSQRWSGEWENPEPWSTKTVDREDVISALANNTFKIQVG